MFTIYFRNYEDHNNLFHQSQHQHLKGAMQIIVETGLPAFIYDSEYGDILWEYPESK